MSISKNRRIRTRIIQSTGDPGKWQAQYRAADLDGLWCDIGDAQTDPAEARRRERNYRAEEELQP